MVREINELLKELGWADGFHLPVADKENKRLEAQVEALIKEKAELILNLEAEKESFSALERQLQNYRNEEIENQTTLNTCRQQMENEYTRLRLSEFEHSRLNQELAQTIKQISVFEEKEISLQKDISRLMAKLDALKYKVEGGEDALAQLAEITAKGLDNNSLLQRFCQEDEDRFNKLEVERLKLKKEVDEREEILNRIVSDKLTLEFELQQCSKLYKKTLHEYKQCVKFWNTSTQFLKLRDKKIGQMYKEITKIKAQAITTYKELREQHKFIEFQKKNNSEVEGEVTEMEKHNNLLKEALFKLMKENDEFVLQVHIERFTLAAIGVKLSETRSLSSTSLSRMELKDVDVARAKTYNVQLQYQFDRLQTETNTQADSNRQLEDIAKELEKSINFVMKDMEKLNLMFTNNQSEVSILKDKATICTNEVQHCQTLVNALNKEAKTINLAINRQQEILYKYTFDITTIESKIAIYDGVQDLHMKEKHMKRIRELTDVFKEKMETFNLINGQLKHAEDDIRRMTAEFERGEIEMHRLNNGRQDRAMNVEGGIKKLRSLQESNQEQQVEHNLLKLQVDQVERVLAKHDETVFNLEKHRLELDAAMKERRLKIQAEKDILMAKRKTLLEEKSELKVSVEQMNTKKYQVQNRFEIALGMLGKADEYISSDPASVTYCKIKLAQEKTELQKRGDELDAKIRKSEKEILAMENTVKLINVTNDSYKSNLSSVEENGPQMEEKKQLEVKYITTVHEAKEREAALKSINAEIKKLETTVAELEITEERVRVDWRLKDKEMRELDKELEEQQQKLQRAEKQLKNVICDVRCMRDIKLPVLFVERDIDVRVLQDINKNAIEMLIELSNQYMETGPVILKYLDEKGLQPKLTKAKVRSSASNSIYASTSEISSSSRLSVISERSSIPSVINLDPFSALACSADNLKGNTHTRSSRTSFQGSVNHKKSARSSSRKPTRDVNI